MHFFKIKPLYLISVLALTVLPAQAILIQHKHNKNDKLHVEISKAIKADNGGYSCPGDTYRHLNNPIAKAKMDKARASDKEQWSSFRVGLTDPEDRYCVRVQYDRESDYCLVFPVHNTGNCKLTFAKPSGFSFSPAVYVADSDFTACGLDPNSSFFADANSASSCPNDGCYICKTNSGSKCSD